MKPERGDDLRSRFVADGVAESHRLGDRLGAIGLERLEREEARTGLRDAARLASSIASQSLRTGAEPVGLLALAIERLLDCVLAGDVIGELALPYAASACHTLTQAFEALANPGKSGARVEGLALEAARYELESLLPLPGAPRKPQGGPDVPLATLVRERAPRPASELQCKRKSESESAPESGTGSDPASKSDSTSDSGSEPESGSMPESAPERELGSESESEWESRSGSASGSRSES